ncbi:MAG: nucleotide exchange factor GrpE [Abitibacteriaceae bacterium]|nr:nucleotide exchange factor GrpE [Abditibacteriaceae bacterium]
MVRLPKLFAETTDDTEDNASGATPSNASAAPSRFGLGAPRGSQDMNDQLSDIRGAMELIYSEIKQVNERESTQEKVFNTLYSELNDYKNDFIYERLKPVVRPLLFLYDSLEQFDEEVASFERPSQEERRAGMSPSLVRQNVSYFKEQLVEALRICEVTLMDRPEGEFDPKLHKAVEVLPVEADQDRKIQKVIRNGWYLNNQLLRPAEVVIGRKK